MEKELGLIHTTITQNVDGYVECLLLGSLD